MCHTCNFFLFDQFTLFFIWRPSWIYENDYKLASCAQVSLDITLLCNDKFRVEDVSHFCFDEN